MGIPPAYIDVSHSIIDRCKNGDQKAYEELYTMYSKAMYNIALRITNNAEEAKEILQDVFLKAFHNINQFDKKYSFGVWIKRIVINRSLDIMKKNKQNFLQLNDDNIPEEEVIEENEIIYDVAVIKKCIQNLPDGYRTILSLILFEDYSHKEISSLLGISEGTSKSQYNRAKKKLIELVKQQNTITDGR